jgi:hypothetical protein
MTLSCANKKDMVKNAFVVWKKGTRQNFEAHGKAPLCHVLDKMHKAKVSGTWQTMSFRK